MSIEKETWIMRKRKWIYNNLVWLLLITACLILMLSMSDLIKSPSKNSIIEKIGLTILSSGVFMAVLKSLQFTGLFKEEIEKVILGTEFVKNRRDLPELWRTISQTIYKRKFPRISKDLEDRILTTYFPTAAEFYYKDYVVTIHIEEITDDFEIIYTQTCKYKVILDEDVKQTELILTSSINQDTSIPKVINTLELFTVNGKDVTPDEDDGTVHDELVKKFVIPLEGDGPFNVHSKYKRRYSLKNENYKLFRMRTFTKNMDVVISYPDDVCVSFFNIGNVTKFEKQHIEVKNQISRTHRNDVILPHQGFGMSFEKKQSNIT